MPRTHLFRWVWVVVGGVLLLLSAITPRTALAEDGGTPEPSEVSTADHTKFPSLQGPFKNPMEVTQACLECHTEAAKQVMHTIHWTWEYQDPVSGKTLGKKHDINNFCVAITSNWPRCTSCHAGYGWKDDEFDFNDPQRVDCLVCHDTTGTYKKFPTLAGFPVSEPKEFGGKTWNPPDLAYVAQHVGKSSRTNCGACHFYGGGGDGVKHGDLDSSLANPPRDVDIHMSPEGANMVCVDCHAETAHQVGGSRYLGHPADTHGKDLPVSDGNPATCQSCHGNAPMHNAKLNDHVDKVACQTCHIPAFARGGIPTKMWWDWSKAGDKSRGTNGVEKDEHGWVVYHFMKGEFKWAENVVPTYAWSNGYLGFTIEGEKVTPDEDGMIYINRPHGQPGEKDARIYPFKVFRGRQAYDPVNQLLIVPHLFPFNQDDTTAYWKGFNWEKAFEVGMKTAHLPYSGQYEWVETVMYWPITHMVAPAEEALQCNECHSRQSRLAGITGVYIPGRDYNDVLDTIGWALSILALVGVVIHGGLRLAASKKS